MVEGLGDMRAVLASADPPLKADVYRDVIGLRLTYRPRDDVLEVSADPWSKVRVGGAITTLRTRAAGRAGSALDPELLLD